MKKLFLISLIALAGASFFTSCNNDDEDTTPAPSIAFQGGVHSLVFTGTNSIDVNVTFTAEGKIESVKLTGPSLTSSGTTQSDITAKMGTSGTDNAKNQTSATYLFKVSSADLLLAFANHTTLTYTFEVLDQNSTSTSASFTVTMQAQTTPLAYENTNGMIWNAIGANLGGWNLGTNAGVSGSSADADLYNTTTTSSPNAWAKEWASKTGCKFVKVTSFDYTNATLEATTAAYAAGTELTTVTPATGDIYITKIKGGTNYAVIKVGTITETPAPADGGDNLDNIAFSYKKLTETSTK